MNTIFLDTSRNACRLLRRKRQLSRYRAHCFSSSGDEKFLTNAGIVEGVWVFCRHGDRTPCRSLAAAHMEPKEAEFWQSRLPYPDATTAFKVLSEVYTPVIHPSNNDGKFFDVGRKPFGFLTEHGMEQMRTNGRRFHNRYEQYGFRLDDIATSDDDNGFMQSWDVRAYSTNYLRTVLSVQCFLDGLLGTNAYDPSKAKRQVSSMKEHEESIIDHTVVPTAENAKVTVNVRARAKDTLNAFDRNPELMKSLVVDVVSSPKFQKYDAKAAPLAARLANYLPGLGNTDRNTFGGPSGINWIDATDHFVCRTAHDVEFSKFSEHEHDIGAEQTLSAMAHQTLAHLAWRFRQWYQSHPLLAAIASPPLREIATMMEATTSLGELEKRPFVVYSCHDVTILSLLYAIGAEFLADELKGEWRFWPPYASTLVFELVRVREDTGPDSHVVRVFLNGQPIRSVNLLDHDGRSEPEYIGHGPMRMLRVTDFVDTVTKLEKAGGLDYAAMGYVDSESERDMSGWTG